MPNPVLPPTREDLSRVLGANEYRLIPTFEALFQLALMVSSWLIIEDDGNTISRGLVAKKQGTPNAETAATTLTIAELIVGIITGTHATGSSINYQLPTGTLSDAGVTFANDDSFDWVLINLSAAVADTITITANTDHTVVGNMIVQANNAASGQIWGNTGTFRTRKTAANTFVTYRIG